MTDYEKTGKTYAKIDAWVKCATPSQAMPAVGVWYYFGTTAQFKTCTGFVQYLSEKHPGHKFKASRAK